MKKQLLSFPILVWLILSSIICIWDAMYMIMRPHSMAGGKYEYIWSPYQTYILADKRYEDMTDGFGIAQSWINLIEIAIALWAVLKHFQGSSSCILLAFTTSVMTAAKTTLYFGTEICSGFEFTGHSIKEEDWFTFWISFVLPSSFWVVIPFIIAIHYGNYLASVLDFHTRSEKQKAN